MAFVLAFAHILRCRRVPLGLVSRMSCLYSHHLLKLCGGNDRVDEELFDRGMEISYKVMLITYYTFKRYLPVARLAFVFQNFIQLALGDVLL